MNVLINPYTGTDTRIDQVYEYFQIQNPKQNTLKNGCASGVCKLSTVKMLPLNVIKKEIIKTYESISLVESKPTVYIFVLNQEDMDMMISASKNWKKIIHNDNFKIILIDN